MGTYEWWSRVFNEQHVTCDLLLCHYGLNQPSSNIIPLFSGLNLHVSSLPYLACLVIGDNNKKEATKDAANGMVVKEILSVSSIVPSGKVEWLGDSRTSRHVCNDRSLL